MSVLQLTRQDTRMHGDWQEDVGSLIKTINHMLDINLSSCPYMSVHNLVFCLRCQIPALINTVCQCLLSHFFFLTKKKQRDIFCWDAVQSWKYNVTTCNMEYSRIMTTIVLDWCDDIYCFTKLFHISCFHHHCTNLLLKNIDLLILCCLIHTTMDQSSESAWRRPHSPSATTHHCLLQWYMRCSQVGIIAVLP